MATAIKSGVNITFTGTGDITLAQIASDINDAAFCTWDGVGKKFRVNCTVARSMTITDDVRVIVGNPLDYSQGETFEIYTTIGTSAFPFTLIVNTLGGFCVYGNSVFDGLVAGSAANTGWVDFRFNGELIIQGNATYRPFIHHFKTFYFDPSGSGYNTAKSISKQILIDYLKIDYMNGTYFIQYYMQRRLGAITFKNIELNSSASVQVYFLNNQGDLSKAEIANITIGDTKRVYRFNTTNYIGLYKISNMTVEANKWAAGYIIQGWGMMLENYIKQHYSQDDNYRLQSQPYHIYDNVIINDQGFGYYTYLAGNEIMCFKNCQFVGTLRSCLAYNNSKIFFWGTTNTPTVTNLNLQDHASAHIVYPLYLTVKDYAGNPIEGATVAVDQSQNFEKYIFITGSDGKPVDIYDYKAILCTWKHIYASAGTFEYWSDGSNGTYHRVTVFKEGYKPYTFNIIMDQDRTVEVTLKKLRQQIAISTKGNLTVLNN